MRFYPGHRVRTLTSARTFGRAALGAGAFAAVVASPAEALLPPAVASATASALEGARFWVNPSTSASRQADAWRKSRPREAALLDQLASTPTGLWLGGWNRDISADVKRAVTSADREGAMPVLVAYNIPNRDCGSHSAGGEKDASGYRRWIRDFARGLAGKRAVVVLEPDATASTDCLSVPQQRERFALLADAVRVLKDANATVYLDAGHAKWRSAADMAARLQQSGIGQADGFALNVSNYVSNAANISFGEALSRRVGGKHFIIDTSRNGAGTATTWCNPSGQATGVAPTTRTGHPLVDAFLWVKQPGESDGSCGGGPSAGTFWPEYALGLVQRSPTYASR
ncbi:MAG: glycoside hydrolase family 6 protein [Gemmatimonadaceae bacterium]